MKLPKLTINLPADFADQLPDLQAVGRGADPRGRDIEAWERDEAVRLNKLEAKKRIAAAAQTAKPEAAE